MQHKSRERDQGMMRLTAVPPLLKSLDRDHYGCILEVQGPRKPWKKLFNKLKDKLMVTVQILDGHMAGQTLDASAFGLTPQDILCGVSGYKWRWETDFSQATEEERDVWSRQDVTMKIVRALAQGLSVRVLEKEYRSETLQDAFQTAAEIEDFLLESGHTAALESDDHTGIVISVR